MDLRIDGTRALRLFLQVQRVLAALCFTGYVIWNIYWVAQGRIPPSIFLKTTGWPCPTTGGSRAIVQFSQGNWNESLRYNAMALPIILLSIVTVGWLVRQAILRGRLSVPISLFWVWIAVLGVAWVLKLTGNPMYW
jgi:hypothetical protein